MVQVKCTNCIHCESAYYQPDNICLPQRLNNSDPGKVSDNIVCKYYEEAPRERQYAGLYGIMIYEIWDDKDGRYVESRPPMIY
ncbi:MAG: hypothetical protein K6E98_02045 [Lachnospiraceae bacterium]|nr:hypothetical protein [Lachnospiraceae bacterium]